MQQDLHPSFSQKKNIAATAQGPVVQKPINANLRLRINQRVYFSTPKCCSTLIFGKSLH